MTADTEPKMSVVDEIAAERKRQIEVEGWTPEHDDEYAHGELSMAAAVYAAHTSADIQIHDPKIHIGRVEEAQRFVRMCWPWSDGWWKPKSRRRNLIRAAALIVAEIERLDRQATHG